jgi:molybdenum cofactor cytidylyltransferase
MRGGDERVEGVILAAGSSSRAAAFKPALPIGGKPMVERCIEGMRPVCSRIIVVGGHDFERLHSLLEGLSGVECVRNATYRKGMFTSVKAGLSRLRGERCFILPVDIPLVPLRVFEALLSVGADIVAPSYHGRSGHPVCCSAAVIPRILSEPDDASLRDVIRAIGVRPVPVDAEEILLDVDTPEEYMRIQDRFAGRGPGVTSTPGGSG